MISARHVVDHAVVVALDDFVAHGVPEIFVAGLVFGYVEVALVVVVDAEGEVDDAVAAMAGIKGVMVHACLAEDLTVEVIGAALADGLLDVG